MRKQLSSGTAVEIVTGAGTSGAPERGLVIVPDIWGLRDLFVEHCERLAAETGWTVACFEPFGRQDLPGADAPDGFAARGEALAAADDADLLADAVEAADLTGAEHVGIIGFCMGGMYAMKAASTGRFDRVVSFYGMAHVQDAWKGPGQGDPVEMIRDNPDVQVVAFIGTEDPFVPADHMDDLEAAGVVVHRYEGADHGFVHDPSRPTHRADDAADAWSKALAFLSGE